MQEYYTSPQNNTQPQRPHASQRLDSFLFKSIDIRAEKWINIMASVILILLFLGAALVVLAALVSLAAGYSNGAIFFGQLLLAFLIVVCGVIYWAAIKVLVNISNNLHIIRGNIEDINNKMKE